MQVQDDNAPYDQVNITPMVDLVFVLLVIFILMCTASVSGTKVNLPKSSNAPASLSKPKTKSISVTLQELEQRLTQIKATTPDLPVVLRGDSLTQYQGVMDVLDVLGRVGLTQVGLATKAANK